MVVSICIVGSDALSTFNHISIVVLVVSPVELCTSCRIDTSTLSHIEGVEFVTLLDNAYTLNNLR